MNAEKDKTEYGSRGWQLDKLQIVKLRESQQKDNLHIEVYSWVLTKKIGITANEKWSIKRVMEVQNQNTNNCLKCDFESLTANRTHF